MPKIAVYSDELPCGYALGIYPCHALLDTRPSIARRLLIHSEAENSPGIRKLKSRCEFLRVRVEVADQALARISRKENCFAAIVFDKYQDTLAKDLPHIVLHQPSDMGNLGTILRTCLGFSFLDLAIIRPAADYFDPRVVRASMGALFGMRVSTFADFSEYRAAFPAHALYPFMLDGSVLLQDAVPASTALPYALVFGNEATGLPAEFAEMGQAVRIPHSGKIDSLNLAVAVSIGAYAFSQGRG